MTFVANNDSAELVNLAYRTKYGDDDNAPSIRRAPATLTALEVRRA